MGCDIHTHVEVESCGKWFFVDGVDDNRNYEFFGYLSGVRGGGEAFFDVLDASVSQEFSDFVRESFERYGNDAHSLTVCDYGALQRMRQDFLKNSEIKRYTVQQLDNWLASCEIYAKIFNKVRVVLWYDN